MSESVLLWILGGFLAAFLALAGALWRHVTQCRAANVLIADIAGDVRRIQQDIGTHETGMRGTLHKTANAVTALQMEVALIRRSDRSR